MIDKNLCPQPLVGKAVLLIEQAIYSSPTRKIILTVNNSTYQISLEGNWFKFSELNKKNNVKKSFIFKTLSEIYNNFIHNTNWAIPVETT